MGGCCGPPTAVVWVFGYVKKQNHPIIWKNLESVLRPGIRNVDVALKHKSYISVYASTGEGFFAIHVPSFLSLPCTCRARPSH